MVFIRKNDGWYVITDSYGRRVQYLYYTKKEALRNFKKRFGYRYKHNVSVIDYT